MPETFYSNCQWPEGELTLADPDNVSTDYHYSYRAAKAVCDGVQREGLGGDGKIFPIRVWVSKTEKGPEYEPPVQGEGNWR